MQVAEIDQILPISLLCATAAICQKLSRNGTLVVSRSKARPSDANLNKMSAS